MSSYLPLHDHWTVRPTTGAEIPATGAKIPATGAEIPAAGPVTPITGPETPAAGPDIPVGIGPDPVPATVPGCVHTDLLAAGLIPDPYLDDNERRLTWIGRTGWTYETTFEWSDPGERTDLVCAGLDTVATVELNGTVLGETANMHRSYRFTATAALRQGTNRLRVHFTDPYSYAERLREELGDRPGAYAEPYNFIRKMACNFGWDWGPTLVTSGIWRPIGLHSWSVARLAEVRPLVTVRDGRGQISIQVSVERTTDAPGTGSSGASSLDPHSTGTDTGTDTGTGTSTGTGTGTGADSDADLTVVARVAGMETTVTIPAGETGCVAELTVDEPELWWPRGYGGQPLYDLEITLDGPGGRLDGWRRRIGFRDVRLDTTPDEHGSAFTIIVNDTPVFARGANWIPDDCFPARVDRTRYAGRLRQACDAGLNLVRVWGGGRYESADFYDLCDELGLLVWQDFAFACAAYPEEGPFPAEVEAEARDNVIRLASHPSLILWCGNNENLVGYVAWGWQERLAGRTWGAGFYLDLLPKIVAELDPTRPYWPGSPYSGDMATDPDDVRHGTSHIWDVWNRRDYVAYREYAARFVAEFGFQGPPAYATLRRAIADEPLASGSPGMLHHQKAENGDAKLAAGLRPHFPTPRTFDDWHYLTQLNQARAVALGIEHFRSLWPISAGTVIWQLNDCWPVTSWAAVDGDGRRKPLWYALRRAYADRLLTVQPRDGGLALVAVNDTGAPWRATASAVRSRFDGTVLGTAEFALDVPPREAVTLPLEPDVAQPGDPRTEVLVATASGLRGLWFFAPDKDLALPAPDFDAAVHPAPDGTHVTITARTLLRDVALFPDRLDPAAEVDDMLVTLLPGETARFHVRSPTPLDQAVLLSPPVLRCVNDIPRD